VAKLIGTAWYADKRAKRDDAAKAMETETDPGRLRKLRGRRDRYKAMLTQGPEGTSEATRKRNETVGSSSPP
jgi:hypothetical protein